MAFKYRVNCNRQVNFFVEQDEVHTAYFNDIRKYETLPYEEERSLLKQAKYGKTVENEARDKLVLANLRFVVSVAKKLANSNNFLDFVNEGNIGLIRAIEKFDLNNKNKFISYAVSWIVYYMRTYKITKDKIVVPPSAMVLETYKTKIKREFFIKNERVPTNEEVADIIADVYGINVNNLDDVEMGKMFSIDETYYLDDETENSIIFSEEYNNRTSSNNVDDNIEDDYNQQQIKHSLDRLTERERFVIEHFYGIGCVNETFEKIAEQIGKSKETVRKTHNYAIEKMREMMKNEL